jgi:hypothetical protein
MINGIEIYTDYITPFKKVYDEINEKVTEVKDTKKKCLDALIPHKGAIKIYSNFRFSYIKDITTLQNIEFSSAFTNEEAIVEIKSLILTIANCNDKLEELLPQLNKASLPIIDSKLHRFILSTFNEGIMDKVFEGYEFDMGHRLSTVLAKRKSRMVFDKQGRTEVKKIINWGDTNKKKAEILARGGTLYEVTKRDEKTNEILEDNGGEKYICYHTGEHRNFLHWNNHKCMVTNRTQFCLEFAYETVIVRFYEFMRNNPTKLVNYIKVYN